MVYGTAARTVGALMTLMLAAGLAPAQDDGEERKLGRALGELSHAAGHCPKLEINGSARSARFTAAKLDPAKPTAAFEAGVADGLSEALQIVVEKGPEAYCKAITERYGPSGSQAKDLLVLKP